MVVLTQVIFKMAKAHYLALALLMTSLGLATSDCPPQRMEISGRCSIRMHCHGTIDNVKLPRQCQGSPNFPVRVEVTLTDAIDRYDDTLLDPEFLDAIITLRVSGNLSETSLSFVEDMAGLEHLLCVNNKIKRIAGKPFYSLDRLEELDLSQNRLIDVTELFEFESSPNRLKRLSLAHNEIRQLDYALEELSSLTELDLSYNHLSDLTDEPFSNLTNLQYLRLNNNRIKDLNGAVNNLFKLKHLFLKGNLLQNIDAESLQIIYHLETFDVSENELDTLKPTVFMRHWLHFEGHQDCSCKIILSGNHIGNIPNATSKEMILRFARNLPNDKVEQDWSKNEIPHEVLVHTELDLSKNEITNVEYNAFQTIVRLTSLDLSNNRLVNFIIDPKDLAEIRFLNLSSNYITLLSFKSFSPMLNLQNLDLSHNQLDFIPDRTFFNNYNLKHVNMTNNHFRTLKHVYIRQFHSEGGVLDLSNNGLSQLQLPPGEALRLTTLVLTSNNIGDAADVNLFHQGDLKTLYMSQNHIHELKKNSLRLPIALAYLDLTSNEINEIGDGSFRRVAHLHTLRLSHNNLTKVNYGTFSGLRELKYLDLSNNKIHFLDSKTLSDLRMLQVLSLSFNEMHHLEYTGWLGHKFALQVYLDGNNITCEWLSGALRDYYNGYSKMRPSVLKQTLSPITLDGIPCISGSGVSQPLVDGRYGATDERLLMNSQKILEAILEQTYYLKKFFWESVKNERKQEKK